MRSYIRVFFIFFCCFFVVSCTSSSGNKTLKYETRASLEKKIISGKTTKDDVIALLGTPQSTGLTDNDGREYMSYSYSSATRNGKEFIPIIGWFGRSGNLEYRSIFIIFKRGTEIVEEFNVSERVREYNTGIFG